MSSLKSRMWMGALVGVMIAGLLVAFVPRVQFVLGGALINLGFRLQDSLEAFDFKHDEDITPDQVWEELKLQNIPASRVRHVFPRTVRHPLVAMLVCMDARIDTSELVGDTRRYYYVVRTAGSVLSQAEQEMLELAVIKGVKVIVLTTHSDCAAEAAHQDPAMRAKFPALISLLDKREQSIKDFLARPTIKTAVDSGKLKIKYAHIDTETEQLIVKNHMD